MLSGKVNFNVTLVAYSEIGLKSKPVRTLLENMLVYHIKHKLKMSQTPFGEVLKERGRVYVAGGEPKRVSQVVSKIFGVEYSAPAVRTSTTIQDIVDTTLEVACGTLEENRSFAVKARRAGDHPYTSKDLEVKAGAVILDQLGRERNLKVKLKSPEQTIFIEARDKNAYVYSDVFRGPGGLPLGSQGRAVALLSCRISTALSAWLMMKRGVFPIIVYLEAPRYHGEKCRELVVRLMGTLRSYIPLPSFKTYILPFEEVMDAASKARSEELRIVVQERAAVRAAFKIAKLKRALGIITGLRLGCEASRLMKHLTFLNEVSGVPLFYPVIGLEQDEVEESAREAGFPELPVTDHAHKPCMEELRGDVGVEEVRSFEEEIDVEKLIDASVEKLEVMEM